VSEFIFDWDGIDDVTGNTRHILDAGVDPRDVEEAILDGDAERQPTRKRHAEPRYIVWGFNQHGETIAVVYERGMENPHLIRPVTAWIVE
jgi:uncharacterized DUF497 family protein